MSQKKTKLAKRTVLELAKIKYQEGKADREKTEAIERHTKSLEAYNYVLAQLIENVPGAAKNGRDDWTILIQNRNYYLTAEQQERMRKDPSLGGLTLEFVETDEVDEDGRGAHFAVTASGWAS